MSAPTESAADLLRVLLPHLHNARRGEIEGLLELLDMFPGQSAADAAKIVKSLLAGSRTTVSAMIQRIRGFVPPATPAEGDSIDIFFADAAKLDAKALQAIAAGLEIKAPKPKKAILTELRRWLEARGVAMPASAEDRMKQRGRDLAGDLPERMGHMTAELAAEVIRRAEAAAKDKELGTEGFREFASLLLGLPAKGSRPALLKQIKTRVERLADSYAQSTAS